MSANSLGTNLGIEITKVEGRYVEGTMPVDDRTRQPYGLLHGGASAALAETLGSVGSHFLVAEQKKAAVGIEINANHLRGKKDGLVTGKATCVHQGGRMHVWNIDIVDEDDQLIATARLTVMIVARS
ncbi:MAG: PaaI family thioesterase [Flavobacteriales bacterium]|nr:PaaI family thioesterase [Flavobacteriales bacterium]